MKSRTREIASLRREIADLRDVLEMMANDEFATEDASDLPEWGGDFERGAMWAFAEASRLLAAALASVGRTEPKGAGD